MCVLLLLILRDASGKFISAATYAVIICIRICVFHIGLYIWTKARARAGFDYYVDYRDEVLLLDRRLGLLSVYIGERDVV